MIIITVIKSMHLYSSPYELYKLHISELQAKTVVQFLSLPRWGCWWGFGVFPVINVHIVCWWRVDWRWFLIWTVRFQCSLQDLDRNRQQCFKHTGPNMLAILWKFHFDSNQNELSAAYATIKYNKMNLGIEGIIEVESQNVNVLQHSIWGWNPFRSLSPGSKPCGWPEPADHLVIPVRVMYDAIMNVTYTRVTLFWHFYLTLRIGDQY